MDYQAVGAPTNYGAPQVFGQQQGQGGQQGGQDQTGQQVAGILQKAKQMMSQGLISADQYNQITGQLFPGGQLDPMAGAPAAQPSAPMNILPGQGG